MTHNILQKIEQFYIISKIMSDSANQRINSTIKKDKHFLIALATLSH